MLEYEERLETVMAARTHGDLSGVLSDLPQIDADGNVVRHDQPDVSKRRAAAKSMIVGWLTLSLFFVGIWALSDFGGYFWPIWPIMGTALGVIPGAYAVWNGAEEPDEDGEGWF